MEESAFNALAEAELARAHALGDVDGVAEQLTQAVDVMAALFDA